MRLPLRHAPPDRDCARERCAHLEALADAAHGLPLRPAADHLAGPRSRGRHGTALQWHFGLAPHDGLPTLDWEDRIEIKLVSVWRRGGALACDKLKVCDIAVDPWRKLSNVLWVFADRMTRVVVGHRFTTLAGEQRLRLAESWRADPHFEQPDLFVEARDQGETSAPAYYLAARWFESEDLLPEAGQGVLPFDARFWSRARAEHGAGRDPLLTVAPADATGSLMCPRCSGRITYQTALLAKQGWAPARHAMPLGDACVLRSHAVVDEAQLVEQPACVTAAEHAAGIESRVLPAALFRLSDRVLEPDDHLH